MRQLICTMAIGVLAVCLFALSAPYVWSEKEEAIYVGMEQCKECHPEHVETYSGWKYSRNFRILELREMEHDSRCLPCHTTGYGKPGGFVSVEETPHMKNIQCE
ncbi:MAG: cytochrome c family protein, partial [Desulfobacterales bacterium]|nr:cytochrome c family protein [Desulfobacterales bacterium]